MNPMPTFTIPPTAFKPEDDAAMRAMKLREANNTMMERIPLELRLQAVYVPLMITDCAIMILSAVREILVASCKERRKHYVMNESDKELRNITRGIKETIDEYESEIRHDVGVLRSTVTEHSTGMFDDMKEHFSTYRYSFVQAIRNAGVEIESNALDLMAFCHLVKAIMKYKREYEREVAKKVSALLAGTGITFNVANNVYQFNIEGYIDGILKKFGVPCVLDDDQLKLCRKILDNKVKAIQFVDESECDD